METKHPLAAWREKQNPKLTQYEFAALVGTSRWAINRIEKRQLMPGRILISAIVKATNSEVGFDDLAGAAA